MSKILVHLRLDTRRKGRNNTETWFKTAWIAIWKASSSELPIGLPRSLPSALSWFWSQIVIPWLAVLQRAWLHRPLQPTSSVSMNVFAISPTWHKDLTGPVWNVSQDLLAQVPSSRLFKTWTSRTALTRNARCWKQLLWTVSATGGNTPKEDKGFGLLFFRCYFSAAALWLLLAEVGGVPFLFSAATFCMNNYIIQSVLHCNSLWTLLVREAHFLFGLCWSFHV